MRRLKLYLYTALAVVLLAGAVAGTMMYAASDNSAPKLWATDDSVMKTVAVNSDAKGPTREQPVYIEAQVERLYGLHIGTPIKVRYVVRTLNSTKIRFDTLVRGVLSRYNTTWRLYQKPTVISEEKKEGFTTRVIEMVVAVWEPPVLPDAAPPADKTADPNAAVKAAAPADPNAGPPQAELWPFAVEFLYSEDKMANGLPKWVYIETPEIKFGFASLVEPGAKEFDFGPLGNAADTNNRLGIALIVGGGIVALGGLTYLVAIFVGWLRRRRIPAPLPVEITQYRFAMAQAEAVRYRPSFLEQKRIAVRDYLGGATKPDEDLAEKWRQHPLYERVVEMLGILAEAVKPGRLSGYEEEHVNKVMDELITARLKPDVHPGWFSRVRARIRLRAARMKFTVRIPPKL